MHIYLFVNFLFVLTVTEAQKLVPVDNGSSVKFVIRNFGFDVSGTFNGLSGSIEFNAKNVAASQFNVTVNSNSINTGNSSRDKHLKAENYFHVKSHPLIQLVATKIGKSTREGSFVFFGKLTIKGITKEVAFPFTIIAEADHLRFTGEFTLKRQDFGIGGKNSISNELKVFLSVLTKKI